MESNGLELPVRRGPPQAPRPVIQLNSARPILCTHREDVSGGLASTAIEVSLVAVPVGPLVTRGPAKEIEVVCRADACLHVGTDTGSVVEDADVSVVARGVQLAPAAEADGAETVIPAASPVVEVTKETMRLRDFIISLLSDRV